MAGGLSASPGGMFNLYKPVGITSHDLVDEVRRVLPGKCGHAGTLDPFARGVMLVCWGKATRLTALFQDLPKRYRAWVRFGITTDTYDVTGTIRDWCDAPVERAAVLEILGQLQGEICQRVPPYSARKFRGQPMYRYARNGLSIPVSEKTVRIDGLQLCALQEGSFGWAELMVECSSGTYIRSLAEELGLQAGTGAYLASLCREGIGRFTLAQSTVLSDGCTSREQILSALLTPDEALYWLDECDIGPEAAGRFQRGNPVPCPGRAGVDQVLVKVIRERNMLGIGRFDLAGGIVKPYIVLG